MIKWSIIISVVMGLIWLILTLLERFVFKKKVIKPEDIIPEKPENDYITQIYNAKVGDSDGSEYGNDNGIY